MFLRRDYSQSFKNAKRPVVKTIREWVRVFNEIVNFIYENESALYHHSKGMRCASNALCGCFLLPCICFSCFGHCGGNGRKIACCNSKVVKAEDFMTGVFETINEKYMMPLIPRGEALTGVRDKELFVRTLEDFIERFESTKDDNKKYYTRVHYILHDAVMPVFFHYYFGNRLSKRTSTTYNLVKLVHAIIADVHKDSDSDETPRYLFAVTPKHARIGLRDF